MVLEETIDKRQNRLLPSLDLRSQNEIRTEEEIARCTGAAAAADKNRRAGRQLEIKAEKGINEA